MVSDQTNQKPNKERFVMNSISYYAHWCQGILKKIRKAKDNGDRHAVSRICNKCRIKGKTVYDWMKKWDGTWQSLLPRSHRPLHHPREHTKEELALIIEVRQFMFERDKQLPRPLLLWQELREKGYTRSYGGLKRFLRKHFAPPAAPLVISEKPQVYEGGSYPGERVQIDVKYVPKACRYGEKLYQYTFIDEYSRWCFREIYAEHNAVTASRFLRNAVKAAPFRVKEVQTDNGYEFTNALSGAKAEDPTRFEETLVELGIAYRRIRVGTPKHNGRVERQHGLDMDRFYIRQRFTSLEDAQCKIADYNLWSNTRIKVCLNFRSPNQVIQDFFA